jgi:Tfp pilus assembly protein PilF
MLKKLQKIKTWQAVLIIAAAGLVVFSTGLGSQFQGDDNSQIINNVQIHSLSHLKLLFEGGTFYNGQESLPLTGSYYRPLMMVTFSLLYNAFGPQAVFFHLIQFLICIGSAIILFLLFRYSFNSILALFLALVFLLHPINSQVAFSIATMQDALFFFFGILAIWLLVRFDSIKSLLLVAVCIFLSLLAKETAMLFIIMALIYLFWFGRRRLLPFAGMLILPVGAWLALKNNAIGLAAINPGNAPIVNLNLAERLMTAPSIMYFYISEIVFPWKMSAAYYWTNPTFSVQHVLLPLMVDLLAIALIIFTGYKLHKVAPKPQFYTYLFFTVWTAIGLGVHLQIIALDFTATLPWIYFSMAGLLGMIGVALTNLQPFKNIDRSKAIIIMIAILVLLGARTFARGFDYKDQYTLASHDIKATSEQFNAYNSMAIYEAEHNDFDKALKHARKSVSIYSAATNNNTLGGILYLKGDYAGAHDAYVNGLKTTDLYDIYLNLVRLTLVYGDPADNEQILVKSLNFFPENYTMWVYYAVQLQRDGNNGSAKNAINQAQRIQPVPGFVYNNIINNQPFTINGVHIPSVK